jgi:hypothetical protein
MKTCGLQSMNDPFQDEIKKVGLRALLKKILRSSGWMNVFVEQPDVKRLNRGTEEGQREEEKSVKGRRHFCHLHFSPLPPFPLTPIFLLTIAVRPCLFLS